MAEWRELGSVPFPYDTTRYYRLTVENEGSTIKASIDGKLVLTADDGELLRGKVGRHRQHPGAVPGLPRHRVGRGRRRGSTTASPGARPSWPSCAPRTHGPSSGSQFATPKFGAGRNARFGDLDGDGMPEMLIAQNIPRIGDNFIQISCLTAVTFDGKVLWQLGRPDPRNGLLTADTPFQIHDIDGDGRNEVVMVKDFQLQVREGSTGRLRQSASMPPALARQSPEAVYAHQRRLARVPRSLGTAGNRREVVVKDRYTQLLGLQRPPGAAVDRARGRPAIIRIPFDIDGDGREELAIGYALWDHHGRQLWSHDDELRDHADGLAVGQLRRRPEGRAARLCLGQRRRVSSCSTAAARSSSTCGSATPRPPASASSAQTCPGSSSCASTSGRTPGSSPLFDADGNLLAQEEPIHSGSPMLPVNWRGDGQEFVLLSGNVREGGMIDGQLRRVVMFPDDGHPDLAAYVANVTGDARDEVILWDQERVWIYTQDRPFIGRAAVRADPQSRLQRVELPHRRLAAPLDRAQVVDRLDRRPKD